MALSTADHIAIHELLALHGHMADEGHRGELARLFTDDIVYDVTDYGQGTVIALPALYELWDNAATEQPQGHHVTNVVVCEAADGTVAVRSKGLSVLADGRAGSVVYADTVVKTAAGWRMRARLCSRRPDLAMRSNCSSKVGQSHQPSEPNSRRRMHDGAPATLQAESWA
jgi:SnoaL-like domain